MSDSVGYSGVTVDGAGFTGSVPVTSTGAASASPDGGYSGVTVDGAGFTGTAPPPATAAQAQGVVGPVPLPTGRAAAASTEAGYADVLFAPVTGDEGSVEFGRLTLSPQERAAQGQYPGATIPPKVLDRQLLVEDLRASAEAGVLSEYSQAGLGGYGYARSEIVGDGSGADAVRVMSAVQANPSAFFPFDVLAPDGSKATDLQPGMTLNLQNRPWAVPALPSGSFPVKVISVTPTSFTFEALPGHFDAPGSMISFATAMDSQGHVVWMNLGTTVPGTSNVMYFFAPAGANVAWYRQASNVREWLKKNP